MPSFLTPCPLPVTVLFVKVIVALGALEIPIPVLSPFEFVAVELIVLFSTVIVPALLLIPTLLLVIVELETVTVSVVLLVTTSPVSVLLEMVIVLVPLESCLAFAGTAIFPLVKVEFEMAILAPNEFSQARAEPLFSPIVSVAFEILTAPVELMETLIVLELIVPPFIVKEASPSSLITPIFSSNWKFEPLLLLGAAFEETILPPSPALIVNVPWV